jgi:hypothetical protein
MDSQFQELEHFGLDDTTGAPYNTNQISRSHMNR